MNFVNKIISKYLKSVDSSKNRMRAFLDTKRNSPIKKSNYLSYLKINFGCGFDKREGYLNVDSDPACKPDVLIPMGDLSLLPKHHFNEVFARDVLEHIPRAKTLDALLEFSSLLHEGGMLFVQTSSITQVARKLAENPSFADQYGWTICLFGNQAHSGDFHHTGFTDTTLTVYLAAAGFEIVNKGMADDWCMWRECRKVGAWDDLLLSNLDAKQFIEAAYAKFFLRPLDNTGLVHFGRQLAIGVDRRIVLKEIATAPEHLFVCARSLGL